MFTWTDFPIEQGCWTYRHTIDLDVSERRFGADVHEALWAGEIGGGGALITCRRRTE
jgi:hypothetical protein